MTVQSGAEAPATSPRPEPRPQVSQTSEAIASSVPTNAADTGISAEMALLLRLRPVRRPDLVLATASPALSLLPMSVPRPAPRPEGLKPQTVAAVRVLPGKDMVVSKKGSVCGIPDIRGETLAPITARTKGCGIANPVRVTSVAGVRLTSPATVTCETAKALRTWVTKAVQPTYGQGNVVALQVFDSYSCRPRNNVRGAKVSEHGRGNAIDIGGFVFANGKTTTVLHGYDKTMRKVHKAACGTFGTTLGPGSDGYHENHLHLDVARYRGGPYCR